MVINTLWEHNGNDTLLYAIDFPGAYARGENPDIAISKMPREIRSYLKWCNADLPEIFEIRVTEEKATELNVKDADSDALFESEKTVLTLEEYEKYKNLALKSANDFWVLYNSVPDKDAVSSPERKTFYGAVPRSAHEMYEHTKNVNQYYFSEIDVPADNSGDIISCRRRGFDALEAKRDFLENQLINGSYGEDWTLRKVLRRFIWHDRIHAKAMFRAASRLFGKGNIENPFCF